MDAADVPPLDECDTHPESPCCKTWPAVASGALIEQASAGGLYPLRAVAFEREQCGFYVAGFDADGGKGRVAVSRLATLTGAPLWTQTFVTEGSGSFANDDAIAVVGTIQAEIPGLRDLLVMLFDTDGEALWETPFVFDGAGQPLSFGDSSDDLGWAVDFDHAGNVIVAGWSDGGRAFLARIAR